MPTMVHQRAWNEPQSSPGAEPEEPLDLDNHSQEAELLKLKNGVETNSKHVETSVSPDEVGNDAIPIDAIQSSEAIPKTETKATDKGKAKTEKAEGKKLAKRRESTPSPSLQ